MTNTHPTEISHRTSRSVGFRGLIMMAVIIIFYLIRLMSSFLYADQIESSSRSMLVFIISGGVELFLFISLWFSRFVRMMPKLTQLLIQFTAALLFLKFGLEARGALLLDKLPANWYLTALSILILLSLSILFFNLRFGFKIEDASK